jgi:two-component system chemotaxis response regulator CheY
MKTIVVEDELTSRIALQTLLSRLGECNVAASGEDAVAAFRVAIQSGSPYDLICMDIRLPGMSGVEAVKEIRAVEKEGGVLSSNGVKILMVTASNELQDVVQSFSALCDGYLRKPVGASAILNELRKLYLIQ